IIASIDRVRLAVGQRRRLWEHTTYVRTVLKRLGFDIGEGDTPIIPIIVGSNELTMEFSRRLQQAGVAAIAIRPPTVPAHQARLRLTVMATHQREDLDFVIDKLAGIGQELGVIE